MSGPDNLLGLDFVQWSKIMSWSVPLSGPEPCFARVPLSDSYTVLHLNSPRWFGIVFGSNSIEMVKNKIFRSLDGSFESV